MLPTLPSVDPHRKAIQAPDYSSWRAKVEATGGCTRPVHLTGKWQLTDKTSGAVLAEKSGHIQSPCGNRRESICPACSDRYAADAFHLLRSGLAGGSKGVPETVAETPRLFVTLTAPSFGPVHNRRTHPGTGKRLPCRCGRFHHDHEPTLGQPINPSSYDYTGHVLWQAHASALWHRLTVALRRHLAQAAGIRVRELPQHARISYAKVAEFQKRGLIHFHAVVRIDGPTGPDDAPPAWATTELLTSAVQAAHAATRVTAPDVDATTRELTWGEQLDIRPIKAAEAHQGEDTRGVITDDRLSSYVAKYATKGTGKSEAADRPLRSREHIDYLVVAEHYKRIMRTAWDLADHDELGDLNLRRWCHMLAFRGHFLTKSRRYSTTFTRLRGDRRHFRLEQNLADLGITDPDSVLVVNHWDMTRIGHDSDAQRDLAEAIAERKRQARQHRYATERKD